MAISPQVQIHQMTIGLLPLQVLIGTILQSYNINKRLSRYLTRLLVVLILFGGLCFPSPRRQNHNITLLLQLLTTTIYYIYSDEHNVYAYNNITEIKPKDCESSPQQPRKQKRYAFPFIAALVPTTDDNLSSKPKLTLADEIRISLFSGAPIPKV